jgi:hypothetical protein
MTPADVAILILGSLVTTLLGIQVHRQNNLAKGLANLTAELAKFMLTASEKYVRGDECKDDQIKCRQTIIEKLDQLTEKRSDAWAQQRVVNGNLWDSLNKHSHTGLPDGAKVVR